MSNKKIIIGAGRHAVEIYYLLEDIGYAQDVEAFAIDSPEKEQSLLKKPVVAIAALQEQYKLNALKPSILVAIGTVAINKRMTSFFHQNGFTFFNAIASNINSKRQQFIGTGITIAGGCVLTCNIFIGNHVIINVGCTISHDCVIKDHVNISPGCHLAGGVEIEEDVFVGVGASFIPNVKVGRGSVVAAGACVTKDVRPYTMVAGVPAIEKKKLNFL
jgi:sugar O-acyltransferase (sialic acid O-acetyltransferase NeuD family)